MGQYLSGVLCSSSFGTSAIKVALSEGRSQWDVLDSSTSCQTSVLIRSQKWWKKFVVKPSRPRALSSLDWVTTMSTSYRDIGRRSIWFCSSVTSLGISWVILSMAGCLSIGGSYWIPLKWPRSTFSISSCCSTCSPCYLVMWWMWFCILLWIVDLWKSFVFISPSFSQSILDFCLHKISSCLCLSFSCFCSSCSLLAKGSVRPAMIIFCCASAICCSRSFSSWKMFPITEWFHFLMWCLRNLSFCWN